MTGYAMNVEEWECDMEDGARCREQSDMKYMHGRMAIGKGIQQDRV